MPGILLLIIGNSNSRLAFARGGSVRPVRVLGTARAVAAPGRFLAGLAAEDAALASVVPGATRPLARALAGVTGRPPFVLNARSGTGLSVRYDRRSLGADRLCAAEGARARWPGDVAVADFGTAVTLNFVSARGIFEGGPILPGPGLILTALARGTAGIRKSPGVMAASRESSDRTRPAVRSAAPVFPRSTRDALLAGALAAVAGGIEYALARAERRTGRSWRLVGTGGNARRFARCLPRLDAVDPLLGCRGLYELYRRNRPG